MLLRLFLVASTSFSWNILRPLFSFLTETKPYPTMFKRSFLFFVSFLALALITQGEAVDVAQFRSPSVENRPWVYWFWNNGNLTREGITADLEAMQRVGIGGVLIMEVSVGAPKGPVDYMGDQWRELFQFALSEAERLGLQVNMNNGPAWQGSGGPWIEPENAMQKLTWSKIELTNHRHYSTVLSRPETMMDFYRDVAAFAFPTPTANPDPNILDPDNSRRRTPREQVPPEAVVPIASLIDMKPHFQSSGVVTGGIPGGNWTVLRFGHTCRGVLTHPAPPGGKGLECDKLSQRAADAAFAGQIARLAGENKDKIGSTFVSTHIDSWENGSQNWTETMREEFLKRRKYDLWPYLPVFAGYVIESAEHTERFLWDFRRTVSEMVLDNYVRRTVELAKQHGLRLSVEAYGSPCDYLEYAGITDEPMGEFWVNNQGFLPSCRGMASAGHIYGKKIIGAEAFTANDVERYLSHPGSMKALGDLVFAEGINRIVFHRYSFQPWNNVKPGGLMMGPYGVHYERTQTWWELTAPWHEYLSRCQYMLRQGDYVADICYVFVEDSPQGFRQFPHNGYAWDQCGAHAVFTMRVENGKVVLPSGMSYEVLVLPVETDRMTPELLEKVRDLIQEGATVIARRPTAALGLTDYPRNDERVRQLAAELWGGETTPAGQRDFGKGKLVWGEMPESVLKKKGIAPALIADRRVNHIHRRTANEDIYFVANSASQPIFVRMDLRATGRPTLWHPETGNEYDIPYYPHGDSTAVMLPLGATESVFIVLDRRAAARSDSVTKIFHDGTLVKDLTVPMSRLLIHRAEYGVPDAIVDVKSAVEEMIASGVTTIPVDAVSALFPDPKHGVVKTLRIEFSYGNRRYTVEAPDRERVFLEGGMPKINVLRATYGPPGDAVKRPSALLFGPVPSTADQAAPPATETIDVQKLLQRLFDAGENRFAVGRLIQSIPDPAPGIEKELEFEYELNGQTTVWKGKDRTQIEFDEVHTESVQLRLSDDSALLFETPGQYECYTVGNGKFDFTVDSAKSLELDGPWTVTFPQKELSFDQLISWSDSADEDVKYFSGTAEYRKTFRFADNGGKRVRLDLGRVEVIAEVTVNGKALDPLWKLEKTADVTEFLLPGAENTIEISVTNLWPNRLIGDDRLFPDVRRQGNGSVAEWPEWLLEGKSDPSGRSTFCMWKLWTKNDDLLPSGLIGPVRLIPMQRFDFKE